MEIINVIETQDGIISKITSFIIPEGCLEEYRDKQIQKAEEIFKKLVNDLKKFYISEEEDLLDEAYFEYNGNEIQIIWSHKIN